MKQFSSDSSNGDKEHSESIPFDLVFEILTRLPTESIARFRGVSKLWDSTIRSAEFTESFFAISTSRPKLLFACRKEGKTLFFTSPQPDQNSSTIAFSYHMSFPSNHLYVNSRSVRGLVCGLSRTMMGMRVGYVPLVCNPSTGQFLNLPKVEVSVEVKMCLGYDPFNKKSKVLCMTRQSEKFHYFEKYQVLTLELGKELSWRMIKCDIPHYHAAVGSIDNNYYAFDEICIQGVCYYFAWLEDDCVVICFNIRSEKFEFIRRARGMCVLLGQFQSTLVNYKGDLAALQMKPIGGICTSIQLWVLKDAEKHEWTKSIYVLPPSWKNIVGKTVLGCVGMTTSGDIVLSPYNICNSFYLLYYNLERKTTTKVEIQGIDAFKACKTYIFLDHTEDVKLWEST